VTAAVHPAHAYLPAPMAIARAARELPDVYTQVEVWAQRARDRAQHTIVTAARVTTVAVDDAFRPLPIEHREPVG
jgi:hypothetical protein